MWNSSYQEFFYVAYPNRFVHYKMDQLVEALETKTFKKTFKAQVHFRLMSLPSH